MQNSVAVTGRLATDPKIRHNTGAKGPWDSGSYRIAVRRNYKDKTGQYPTDFFNVEVTNGNARFAEKYLKKGTMVALTGILRNDSWRDKDGAYRDKIVIRVLTQSIIASRPSENKDEPDRPAVSEDLSAAEQAEIVDDPEDTYNEDDFLPFTPDNIEDLFL